MKFEKFMQKKLFLAVVAIIKAWFRFLGLDYNKSKDIRLAKIIVIAFVIAVIFICEYIGFIDWFHGLI